MAEGVRGKDTQAKFYKAFYDTVRRHGRLHEVEFITQYSGTRPSDLLSKAPLGLTLLRKVKMSLTAHGIQAKHQLETIFRRAEELEGKR